MRPKSCIIFLATISSFPITFSKPPNIIIILADDLGRLPSEIRMDEATFLKILTHFTGFHDVSWHNSEIITPNMEGLARSGIILENAYMQPMCTASRAALLTGYYPIHTGRQVRFGNNGLITIEWDLAFRIL